MRYKTLTFNSQNDNKYLTDIYQKYVFSYVTSLIFDELI